VEAPRCELLPRGYTSSMKTAISLPDDVFHEAERFAKRTRKSRSRLYAEALAEYLARHSPDEVTERMNDVLHEIGQPEVDPFLNHASRRVLKDVEW
jgi:metal-responsive CopG/Arc/MetJ family transcriptional regulator